MEPALPPAPIRLVLIKDGNIAALGDTGKVTVPAEATIIDLSGKSVIPGLVMVHEHLYYPTGPNVYGQLGASFVRLYLAGGVTTMRTGGNTNGVMDISLKQQIDAGLQAGPALDATAPVPQWPAGSAADARAEGRGRRPSSGRVLGRAWARPRSRPTCRSRATSCARPSRRRTERAEGHRPSVLGHLRGSGGPRHRRSRARLHGVDRFRPRQAARRVPRSGHRPEDDCRARRTERAVQGARSQAGRQARGADVDADRVRDVHAGSARRRRAWTFSCRSSKSSSSRRTSASSRTRNRSTRRSFRRAWRSSARSRARAGC